jgi:hypothetical protein
MLVIIALARVLFLAVDISAPLEPIVRKELTVSCIVHRELLARLLAKHLLPRALNVKKERTVLIMELRTTGLHVRRTITVRKEPCIIASFHAPRVHTLKPQDFIVLRSVRIVLEGIIALAGCRHYLVLPVHTIPPLEEPPTPVAFRVKPALPAQLPEWW